MQLRRVGCKREDHRGVRLRSHSAALDQPPRRRRDTGALPALLLLLLLALLLAAAPAVLLVLAVAVVEAGPPVWLLGEPVAARKPGRRVAAGCWLAAAALAQPAVLG